MQITYSNRKDFHPDHLVPIRKSRRKPRMASSLVQEGSTLLQETDKSEGPDFVFGFSMKTPIKSLQALFSQSFKGDADAKDQFGEGLENTNGQKEDDEDEDEKEGDVCERSGSRWTVESQPF